MKRDPNAITLDGRTFTKGAKVRCHYGEATISRLYWPSVNETGFRAMLDRGPDLPPIARYPIVALEKLELVTDDAWESVGDAASRVVSGLRVRKSA